jgi:hypothetical protein
MEDQVTTDLRFSIVPHWIIKHDISDRALRLYSVLAGFADSETNQAFPGRTRLSKELRCSLKSVDRAVGELEQIGAIRKKQRVKDGHYQSSLYTVVRIDPASSVTLPRDTHDATPRQDRRDPVSPVTHRTRTTELEPLEQKPVNYIGDFDQFWNIYPKKADKALARRSFEKALKRTTLDVILAGAERYRDDPGRDPEFTKNPSTWLNAEAWDNDPLPVKSADISTPGPGKREWVRAFHEDGDHWACEPGEFGCK